MSYRQSEEMRANGVTCMPFVLGERGWGEAVTLNARCTDTVFGILRYTVPHYLFLVF